MKRYIRSSTDLFKEKVYNAVAEYYYDHEDEILEDYEDYKRKYNLYDTSLLQFLRDNLNYFDIAVMKAVPGQGKRGIFVLYGMDVEDLEELLFS